MPEKPLRKSPSFYLLAIALVGSFFSYTPTIQFGEIMGTNLEVSVTQLTILLLILGSVGLIIEQRALIIKSRIIQLLTLSSMVMTVSLIWTPNVPRGVLFAGLAWVITALWCAVVAQRNTAIKHKKTLTTIFMVTVLFVCAFAWYQVFGDAFGWPLSVTLLTEPYTSYLFGFARPTAFALEPQFLGSLLLAPIFYTMYKEFQNKATLLSRIVMFASYATLIATVSRGALIAFLVGAAILVLLHITKGTLLIKSLSKIVAILTLSTVVSIGTLALAAQIKTTDTVNGYRAIAKALNHVSLGLITLNQSTPQPTQPPAPATKANDPAIETTETTTAPAAETTAPVETKQTTVESQSEPVIGYVPESTTSRVLMSKEALSIWTRDVRTILFGVGIGGFGVTLNAKDPTYLVKSIVNNQFLEILVETGIVGLGVFLSILGLLFTLFIKRRNWLLVALLPAYCVQWCFFSGTVNVLHIWLLLALAYVVLTYTKQPRKL